MKIAYITNSFSIAGGGLVGAVSGLARGVAFRRHSVTIFGYESEEVSNAWNDLEIIPVKAKRIAGLYFGGNLENMLGDFSPDVSHSHGIWLRASANNYNWCRRSETPYLVSPHGMLDSWAIKNSAWKKKLVGSLFENKHLQSAACLHALCLSELESIREYGLNNPVGVIPNGISLPVDSMEITTAPWRNDRNRKVLLFVGRIHPKKGLSLLVEAWRDLILKIPRVKDEWFLIIAGWSELNHRAELELQVNELGIQDLVEFTGPVQGLEKDAAFRAASAFILPSYSEGLPISVLEAWSFGLPVVMSPECNLPEGYSSRSAIRCETSVDSVMSALCDLVEMTDAEREDIGSRGLELVKKKFEWNHVADHMIALYDWLLGGGDVPGFVETN